MRSSSSKIFWFQLGRRQLPRPMASGPGAPSAAVGPSPQSGEANGPPSEIQYSATPIAATRVWSECGILPLGGPERPQMTDRAATTGTAGAFSKRPRASLIRVEEGDTPAVTQLREQRTGRQRDVGQESLVELRLAGDLVDRSDVDPGGCACR